MTWPASIEALRLRLGWRAARRLVSARASRTPVAADRVRRILVALPGDPESLRASWPLVEALGAPLVLAMSGASVERTPDEYAGEIVRVGPDKTGWIGLPTPAVRARLWPADLDVAISLCPADDLVASALVGAAPVGLRIGNDAPATTGFFDLALRTENPARALLGRLGQISPPVVPLRP